jgi:N-acetylmuramoyl-L-alanine amidase
MSNTQRRNFISSMHAGLKILCAAKIEPLRLVALSLILPKCKQESIGTNNPNKKIGTGACKPENRLSGMSFTEQFEMLELAHEEIKTWTLPLTDKISENKKTRFGEFLFEFKQPSKSIRFEIEFDKTVSSFIEENILNIGLFANGFNKSALIPYASIKIPFQDQKNNPHSDLFVFTEGKFFGYVFFDESVNQVSFEFKKAPNYDEFDNIFIAKILQNTKIHVVAEVEWNKNDLLLEGLNLLPNEPPKGFSSFPPDVVFVSRSGWGAKAPKQKTVVGKGWKTIVIHHTAGFVAEGSNYSTVVRGVQQAHLNNTWSDIGYHFLVAPDGKVFEGREGGKNIVGAHATGYNENTCGVNLIGQFESGEQARLGLNKPTEAAIKSTAKILAWLCYECGIELHSSGKLEGAKPDAVIPSVSYHRFVGENSIKSGNGTACPGNLLIEKIPEILKLAEKELAELKSKKTGC